MRGAVRHGPGRVLVSSAHASHLHVRRTAPTLTVRLQLNPDFDRGFPRSECLMHACARGEEISLSLSLLLITIGVSCSLIVGVEG